MADSTVAQINALHDEAMRIAAEAFWLDRDEANRLYAVAFLLEQQAAVMADRLHIEPSRSVLILSAASLAFNCGNTKEAERLIVLGLTGNTPARIADELFSLQERING